MSEPPPNEFVVLPIPAPPSVAQLQHAIEQQQHEWHANLGRARCSASAAAAAASPSRRVHSREQSPSRGVQFDTRTPPAQQRQAGTAAASSLQQARPGGGARTTRTPATQPPPASSADDGALMPPPPRETHKERRVQQQREILGQTVSVAQAQASESAVREQLLKHELIGTEATLVAANNALRGARAERNDLAHQLAQLGERLRSANFGGGAKGGRRTVSMSAAATDDNNTSDGARRGGGSATSRRVGGGFSYRKGAGGSGGGGASARGDTSGAASSDGEALHPPHAAPYHATLHTRLTPRVQPLQFHFHSVPRPTLLTRLLEPHARASDCQSGPALPMPLPRRRAGGRRGARGLARIGAAARSRAAAALLGSLGSLGRQGVGARVARPHAAGRAGGAARAGADASVEDETGVLPVAPLATIGSAGCIGRPRAAQHTREEGPSVSDPTERPWPWNQAAPDVIGVDMPHATTQVLMLQEQMALAAQRRQQVPEGLMAAVAGEAAGATPATGLHARLLYAETQSLEAELAEARETARRMEASRAVETVAQMLLPGHGRASRAGEPLPAARGPLWPCHNVRTRVAPRAACSLLLSPRPTTARSCSSRASSSSMRASRSPRRSTSTSRPSRAPRSTGAVETAVLATPRLATAGSSGCIRRLGAVLRTREEAPSTSDPAERPWPGGRPHQTHRGPLRLTMQADRRVLARHSRDFLDGKHAVEKDKAALRAQVEELASPCRCLCPSL